MPATKSLFSRLDREQPLLKPLLIGLAAILLLLAFVYGGSEIMEGDTRQFDNHLLHVSQSLRAGHAWLASAMRDLSGLGSIVVLALMVGVSRVLLGVNWATDVLDGWAFVTAWAVAWLLLARQLLKDRPG